MLSARSKNPLTAATTSILIPSVKDMGFNRKTGRIIARVSADILQYIYLQVSAYGGKDFCVSYASITLFNPRDFLVLSPGSRLRGANRADAWLPALTYDEADASMREVLSMFKDQAMPFFRSTETLNGMLQCLKAQKWAALHHLNFEIACCLAKMGRFRESKRHVAHAIDLYRKDGRPWAIKNAELAEQLLAALEVRSEMELLNKWRQHSIDKLKLHQLLNVAGEAA